MNEENWSSEKIISKYNQSTYLVERLKQELVLAEAEQSRWTKLKNGK
jgi:hypothetical protein